MILKTLLLARNRYLYLALSLSVLILIQVSLWYIILFVPLTYYIYKRHLDLIFLIFIILLVYFFSVVTFQNINIKEEEYYQVTVISDIKVEEYTSFLGKVGTQYLKVYFDESLDIKPGDKYKITGELVTPMKSTIPHSFDYKNYLLAQNIKKTIFADSFEYVGNSFNINVIPYKIGEYIDVNFELAGKYIKTFVLADSSELNEITSAQINKVGISHLFAVSGLHIALIVIGLQYLLNKTKLLTKNKENIIIIFLMFYLVITSFTPSVTRASIMYVLLIINKRYKLLFSSLDILSIIFTLLLIIRPFYYYDAGFLLSFLVTFIILLSNKILKKESKIKQLFLISFVAFMATIPIILSLNHQINLLSLIFNIIFLVYISYVILPLLYLVFILPFLDKIGDLFINIFEYLLEISSSFNLFIVEFAFPNQFFIIIYYFLTFKLLVSIEKRSRFLFNLGILFVYLLIIYLSPYINITKSVTFIDIYGDSTLIVDSYNRCNILIDTGEVDKYDSVVNYLKSKNIKRLDYLIISHFHSDHSGEIDDLLQEFIVINLVSKNNVLSYQNYQISCGSIQMFIYPLDYTDKNENNNSIIMSLMISDKHYLFTGDTELSKETDFINQYSIDIDYLKVAHHGSNTSSSIDFIKSVTPVKAFITVSRKNTHGHPHEDVVNRFLDFNIEVYRTDTLGTIEMIYLFGKEYKRVHSP